MAHRYRPFINGGKVSNCFTADEEQGICICHKTDENGNLVLNEERTEILEETFHGKVELRLVR